MRGASASVRPLSSKVKPFFAVDPVYTLLVDVPALTPKKRMNTKISISDSGLCDLTDACAQERIIFPPRAVPVRGATDTYDLATTPLADFICFLEILHLCSLPGWL